MYTVKNIRTGNKIKNAIDGKQFVYATIEEAEIAAAGMNVFAVAGGKRDRYMVVKK